MLLQRYGALLRRQVALDRWPVHGPIYSATTGHAESRSSPISHQLFPDAIWDDYFDIARGGDRSLRLLDTWGALLLGKDKLHTLPKLTGMVQAIRRLC